MLNPKPALSVPDGYFEGFAASMMSKIRSVEKIESEELSVTLNAIGKEMPFEVPSGYMDAFAGNVLNSVRPAKVIQMTGTRRSVFKYAMAAVVTGLLGLGIFNGLNNKDALRDQSEQKVILAEARNILSTNSFEQTLESIPAEDIITYLEAMGQDVDAAIVAVAASSQEDLPEPEEYLFDEKALEKFLNGPGFETLN